MEMERYRVGAGDRVRLAKLATEERGEFAGKKEARAALKPLRKEIDERLRMMAAQARFSLIVILQGMDAAGKDGAVRHVFTGVNPANCLVTSFKAPGPVEQAHNFLWRIEQHTPERGQMAVWNRSQYEDVLVERARGGMDKGEVTTRLRQIAERERSWGESGVTVLKFFLHISKQEQARRFASRRETPRKQWKVQASDARDRQRWPEFQAAYEAAIEGTSTKDAPWYVVPADHKWYRDVVIATVVLEAMRRMAITWLKGAAG